MKLVLLAAGLLAGSVVQADTKSVTPACGARAQWPIWSHYQKQFITSAGRVVDRTAGGRTTSEAQSYGMFFALVAGDRPLFDRLVSWTRDNLAQGDLGRHLSAWHWARDAHGRWRVIDGNAASDADLWIAYSLLEAGRLWSRRDYTDLAHRVVANIERAEVAILPALGPALLPAPFGFEVEREKAWRLNPSYLPPQLLRRFAAVGLPGPWPALLDGTVRLIRETAQNGFVADWVLYSTEHGFSADPISGPVGSYDAIRVYLWVSMLDAGDPLLAPLASSIDGLYRMARRRAELPERVYLNVGRAEGHAPPGFWAVVLTEAERRGDRATARWLEQKLARQQHQGLYGNPPSYYDQNLILFAQGFLSGRFRFNRDGSLRPSWSASCGSH